MLHRLDNGTQVFVRPIREDDKRSLQHALGCLSDASVRARFLAPKDRFSRGELAYLTEVDGQDHVALVALDVAAPAAAGRLLAVARYVRDGEHPEQAEIAITVADHLHGQGLGRLLGELLADAARDHGITRFTASMLADNAAALGLFDTISQRLTTTPLGGSVRELTADLAA